MIDPLETSACQRTLAYLALSTLMELVILRGKSVKMYKNLLGAQLKALVLKSSYSSYRGILTQSGDLFFADSADAIHADLATKMLSNYRDWYVCFVVHLIDGDYFLELHPSIYIRHLTENPLFKSYLSSGFKLYSERKQPTYDPDQYPIDPHDIYQHKLDPDNNLILAGLVTRVELRGKPINIYHEPTWTQLKALIKQSMDYSYRGILTESGDLFFADAYYILHTDIARKMMPKLSNWYICLYVKFDVDSKQFYLEYDHGAYDRYLFTNKRILSYFKYGCKLKNKMAHKIETLEEFQSHPPYDLA